MTIQEVLNKATLFLQNKGYTSARLDAEILLSHCLGIDKVKLYINYSQDLNEDELKAAVELSEREGKIESEERELVEKALEFNQHSAEEIMTPRSKIFALPDVGNNCPVKILIRVVLPAPFLP